ncbi:hypothetical protein D3C76_1306110 [compost metagenome]
MGQQVVDCYPVAMPVFRHISGNIPVQPELPLFMKLQHSRRRKLLGNAGDFEDRGGCIGNSQLQAGKPVPLMQKNLIALRNQNRSAKPPCIRPSLHIYIQIVLNILHPVPSHSCPHYKRQLPQPACKKRTA